MMFKIVLACLSIWLAQAACPAEKWGSQVACPFNEQECNCIMGKNPNEIEYAECCSVNPAKTMPKLTPKPGVKYNVSSFTFHEMFGIMEGGIDIRVIPADYFDGFQNINKLSLIQNDNISPAKQNWDANAFRGVSIKDMFVYRLSDMVPLPQALKNVPSLQSFDLNCGREKVDFPDNSFTGMQKLNSMGFLFCNVTDVSSNAFAGVEPQLTQLEFWYSSFNDSHLNKLAPNLPKFKKLQMFSLFEVEIKNVDLAIFADLPDGVTLRIPYNDYESVSASKVDKFPKNAEVWQWFSPIEKVDSKISQLLKNAPTLKMDWTMSEFGNCAELDWLAEFSCPERVNIDGWVLDPKNGARCNKSGVMILVDEYLKTIDPNTKCVRSKNPPMLERVEHKNGMPNFVLKQSKGSLFKKTSN